MISDETTIPIKLSLAKRIIVAFAKVIISQDELKECLDEFEDEMEPILKKQEEEEIKDKKKHWTERNRVKRQIRNQE